MVSRTLPAPVVILTVALTGVYRFLLSRRWLGLALLMVLVAVGMVVLGLWQYERYQVRAQINDRIDAAGTAEPRPLADVLAPPTDRTGAAPGEELAWTRVTATGRFDPAQEFYARGRTVHDRVGLEVITPLVLADGSAVLVNRGWIPPDVPVPAPPAGEVTVVGRVHQPESRAGAIEVLDGRREVRRISPEAVAAGVPYRLYGAYLTVEDPGDEAFTPIPPDRQNSLLNAGYVVQWFLFAGLTLSGYYYLARREARTRTGAPPKDRLAV
jgi:cytochrome oxidase assembly protein ShyY1